MDGELSVHAVRAKVGARGFDTIARLTPDKCKSLVDAGMTYAVRYLGSLTRAERDVALGAGLALMGVAYCRAPGWAPTVGMGSQDGANAGFGALRAGLARGTTLWCDVEGVATGTPSLDVVVYVNAWASAVRAAGFEPGLYVGAGSILNSSQLFHSLSVARYWRSGSLVPDVDVRGYCMRQESPLDVVVSGVRIDRDTVTGDALGDVPAWTVAGAEEDTSPDSPRALAAAL